MSASSSILFISSEEALWGGSDELWHSAALILAKEGHSVTAVKSRWSTSHDRYRKLVTADVNVWALYDNPKIRKHQRRKQRWQTITQYLSKVGFLHDVLSRYQAFKERIYTYWNLEDYYAFGGLYNHLKSHRYDLIVLNQAENYDGHPYMNLLGKFSYPYVILSQKASELLWPSSEILEDLQHGFSKAKASYFVSEHNKELTEQQIGIVLNHSMIVQNPSKPMPLEEDATSSFPSLNHGLNLACIGRYWFLDKGQDLLVNVFRQQKWRERAVYLSFYGSGPHEMALNSLITMYDLKNVSIKGYEADIQKIWSTHHALLLGSRAEGLPLVLLEAMQCGRAYIGPATAGIGEVIQEGQTGFLAESASVEAIDKALERAYKVQVELEKMGQQGAKVVKDRLKKHPGQFFAEQIKSHLNCHT